MNFDTEQKRKMYTTSTWNEIGNDIILYAGEIGVELCKDGGTSFTRIKIGDGINTWNKLGYFTGSSSGSGYITDVKPSEGNFQNNNGVIMIPAASDDYGLVKNVGADESGIIFNNGQGKIIKLQIKTEAQWKESNIILSKGEVGFIVEEKEGKEIATGFKVGNGVNHWEDLPTFKGLKGDVGEKGDPGKSAYELYKQQNPEYKGTLDEWLASLHGEQGRPGADGQNGQDGVDGINGQDGNNVVGFTTDYNYTYAKWKEYSEPGYTSTWNVNENITAREGDIAFLAVTVSDRKNSDGFLYGKILTITDKSLLISSLGFICEGPQGPRGQEGMDGQNGKSSYQLALENGFIGTEEEWLKSLIGPQGPQGEQGTSLDIRGQVNTAEELPPASEDIKNISYFVGTEPPRDIYWCSGTEWINQGPLKGEKGDPGEPGTGLEEPQYIKVTSNNKEVYTGLEELSEPTIITKQQLYYDKIYGTTQLVSPNLLNIFDQSVPGNNITCEVKGGIIRLNGLMNKGKFTHFLQADASPRFYTFYCDFSGVSGNVKLALYNNNVLIAEIDKATPLISFIHEKRVTTIQLTIEQAQTFSNLELKPMLLMDKKEQIDFKTFYSFNDKIESSNAILKYTSMNVCNNKWIQENAQRFTTKDFIRVPQNSLLFLKSERIYDFHFSTAVVRLYDEDKQELGFERIDNTEDSTKFINIQRPCAYIRFTYFINVDRNNIKESDFNNSFKLKVFFVQNSMLSKVEQIKKWVDNNGISDYTEYVVDDIGPLTRLDYIDNHSGKKVLRTSLKTLISKAGSGWYKGLSFVGPEDNFDETGCFHAGTSFSACCDSDKINVISNYKSVSYNDLANGEYGVSISSNKKGDWTYINIRTPLKTTSPSDLIEWLDKNEFFIQYIIKDVREEDFNILNGLYVENGSLQIQEGKIPYILEKEYQTNFTAKVDVIESIIAGQNKRMNDFITEQKLKENISYEISSQGAEVISQGNTKNYSILTQNVPIIKIEGNKYIENINILKLENQPEQTINNFSFKIENNKIFITKQEKPSIETTILDQDVTLPIGQYTFSFEGYMEQNSDTDIRNFKILLTFKNGSQQIITEPEYRPSSGEFQLIYNKENKSMLTNIKLIIPTTFNWFYSSNYNSYIQLRIFEGKKTVNEIPLYDSIIPNEERFITNKSFYSTGLNLLDGETLEWNRDKKIENLDWEWRSVTDLCHLYRGNYYVTKNFYPINPGKYYIYTFFTENNIGPSNAKGEIDVYFYNKDKHYIGFDDNYTWDTIIIPNDCAYIKIATKIPRHSKPDYPPSKVCMMLESTRPLDKNGIPVTYIPSRKSYLGKIGTLEPFDEINLKEKIKKIYTEKENIQYLLHSKMIGDKPYAYIDLSSHTREYLFEAGSGCFIFGVEPDINYRAYIPLDDISDINILDQYFRDKYVYYKSIKPKKEISIDFPSSTLIIEPGSIITQGTAESSIENLNFYNFTANYTVSMAGQIENNIQVDKEQQEQIFKQQKQIFDIIENKMSYIKYYSKTGYFINEKATQDIIKDILKEKDSTTYSDKIIIIACKELGHKDVIIAFMYKVDADKVLILKNNRIETWQYEKRYDKWTIDTESRFVRRSNERDCVYGTTKLYKVSEKDLGNAIPLRTAGGQLIAADPENLFDLVNKNYADKHYATQENLSQKLGKNEKATDSNKLNGETKTDIIKGLITETQLKNSNGSVSNTTGVPSVVVSPNEKGGLNFTFTNIKGEPGKDGAPGKQGEPGKDGAPGKQGEPGKDAANKRVRIFYGFNSRTVTLTESAANFDYLEVQIRVTGAWYRLPALILTSGSRTGMVAACDEENSPKSIYLARATLTDNYTIELRTMGYARIDNGAFTGRLGNSDYGIMAVYGIISG